MKVLQLVIGIFLMIGVVVSGLGFFMYEKAPGGAYGAGYVAGRIAGLCLFGALALALIRNGLATDKPKRGSRRPVYEDDEEDYDDEDDDDRPRRGRHRSP